MGRSTVEALLAEQEGVVSRRQVLAHGLDDSFVETMLHRREWSRVHHGVYVNHTGFADIPAAGLGRRALLLAGRALPRVGSCCPRGPGDPGSRA